MRREVLVGDRAGAVEDERLVETPPGRAGGGVEGRQRLGSGSATGQRVRDWMRDLAAEARAADPERLADGPVLVRNGVYVTVTATVLGPESPEGPARRTAELGRRLVEAACDGPGRP
ncbi:hypothetical protein [Streptomyces griseoviridis]|uniref:hypothetical protein n=1 Tax=Streptomyces griseoviridis TaxID=45398 RepID=UPI00344A958D